MKCLYILTFFMLAVAKAVTAQPEAVRRVVLASGQCSEEVLLAIREIVPLDTATTVLFLGDAVSAEDSNRWNYMDASAAIVAGTSAQAIFLPGNREWKAGDKSGEKFRKDVGKHLAAMQRENIVLYPEDGCPGPHMISLDKHIRLIIMDTQWWLQKGDKPGIESDCPCKNEQQILDKLDDMISENGDKLILFAGHHSFRSTGIRSGYFGPRQHFFPLTDIRGLRNAYLPLPIAGSLYPIIRSVGISRQDAAHPDYARMVASLDGVLKEHPFVLRLSGGESALQLYEDDGQYYLLSGAGRKAGRLVRTRHTPFVGQHTGFALLEITRDNKTTVIFYEIVDGKVTEAFRQLLPGFNAHPLLKQAAPAKPVAFSGDSVAAAVHAKYGEVSASRRLLLGENYRAEWTTPVMLPILHLADDAREFAINGQGGGNQTTSIRLKDKDGKKWSLRSIVKDPSRVLPPAMRATIAESAMKDLLSASHPFAPLISSKLAAAAGILSPQISYYFVPDDSALGRYGPAFANTVASLEEQQPSKYDEDTKSTWSVHNDHFEKWNHSIDARSYLRARMLDILMGDFDRHYDQWKWGKHPPGPDSQKVYYAIPKDHDQAFYHSDGPFNKLVAMQGMSYISGLQKDIENVTSMGFVARDIDAFFLNELSAEEWKDELESLIAALTDSAIHNSVLGMPVPAYAAHGPWLEERLKQRRNALDRRGMEYYRFLAKQVNIVGSNKEERFLVTETDSGLRVSLHGNDATGRTKYIRTFRQDETSEIRLYGLGGDDKFLIDPTVSRGIRLRIVGGKGQDTFDVQGRAKTFVYDAGGGGNLLLNRSHVTNMISQRDDVNEYVFRENNYGSVAVPVVNLGFNIDDGFLIGLGAVITKRGFRANPFTTQHRLATLASFSNKAYQFRYIGIFNDAWRRNDVVLSGSVLHPALQNFFGLGNETAKDPNLPMRFYRVRYSYAEADALLRKRLLHNKLSLAAGLSTLYYWNNADRNSSRILDHPELHGLDTSRIYLSKWYAGGKLSIDFTTIDKQLLPTRGVRFHADGIALGGLNDAATSLLRAQADVAIYAPLSDNKRFIIALRGGGGHIFSDQFEYWQALTLGANNFLRGYRKSRFSGSSMAYTSAELRWRMARIKGRIMPGELGLTTFYDGGRVWLRNEISTKWHTAYGGGIYFTPFNSVLVSALAAVSEEEALMNISVGMGLNITF